jgi:hypothetical protein
MRGEQLVSSTPTTFSARELSQLRARLKASDTVGPKLNRSRRAAAQAGGTASGPGRERLANSQQEAGL